MAKRAAGTLVGPEFLRDHAKMARAFARLAAGQGRKTAAVILQNAWSGAYAGGIWSRRSWLRALDGCPTGRRLNLMAARCEPGVLLWYDNTTPIVGPRPNSVVPADYGHMRNLLEALEPAYIVTCGVFAADALAMIRRAAVAQFMKDGPITQEHARLPDGPLIRPWLRLPHPVARNEGVTNALFERAGDALARGFDGFLHLSSESTSRFGAGPDDPHMQVMVSTKLKFERRPVGRMDAKGG